MSETFNFRNPDPQEVKDINAQASELRVQREKYRCLGELFDKGKTDISNCPELFEALNREKLDFESIMKLHPKEVDDAMEQARIDRSNFSDGKWWNFRSQAKWGLKGYIPNCVYYSRPGEYWKDERLVKNFFNTFPRLRISTKPL